MPGNRAADPANRRARELPQLARDDSETERFRDLTYVSGAERAAYRHVAAERLRSFATTIGSAMATATQDRAANYRQQAAHIRELAEAEDHGQFQQALLRLADEYDRLAKALDGDGTEGSRA